MHEEMWFLHLFETHKSVGLISKPQVYSYNLWEGITWFSKSSIILQTFAQQRLSQISTPDLPYHLVSSVTMVIIHCVVNKTNLFLQFMSLLAMLCILICN